MKSSQESHASRKHDQAHEELARLLSAAAQRGFYGTVALTVSVQDGSIQHLRVATDRLVR